ncbi:MAG: HAMP domain-containing protein [Spirulina sp. SIO3F2]|nr:HAMP domain-containing protein [Spirulina sp. SIO3F2]
MFKLWKTRLLIQLVGSFSLLSITIVALVAAIAFQQARQSLKASVFQRLTAVAALKENELNRWLTDRRDSLLALSTLPEINRQTITVLSTPRDEPAHQAASDNLQASLKGLIRNGIGFKEMFVLSRSGRILMSTDSQRVGRYETTIEHSEVISTASQNITANFYPSPDTNKPTVTFTTPILNEAGQSLGILAAHLNLDELDGIIRNNQGLEGAGESYLVADLGSSYHSRHVFVSAEEFSSEDFPEGVESPGISAAIAGNNGTGLYLNYRGVPVIGAYRWLAQQNVAFLVEVEQREAFALARQLARRIVFAGLGLAALLMIGIVLLGQQILRPILAIANTAHLVEAKVKTGNISNLETAPILANNEIGLLAKTFNEMTQELQKAYTQLANYSRTLEEKVSIRTQEVESKNKVLETTLSKLKQTQAQLIQTEKMAGLGQMVAGIAHEVNNPVNFIHGNLEHLRTYAQYLLGLCSLYAQEYPVETSKITDYKAEIDIAYLQADLLNILKSIKLGTTRIQDIVLSMRNFSRLDESDFKIADIHEGLDNTIMILQHRLKATSQHPEIRICKDYDSIPNIECFPGQLNQVFLNLISNAIDALIEMSEQSAMFKPEITISTQQTEAEGIVIAIADNGLGMSEATRKKIFDPFFTTKAVGEGTGLGLSVSYAIVVERHGGTIQCDSTPGLGTTFLVMLPIRRTVLTVD